MARITDKTVKSKYPPKQTNVTWIDTSQKPAVTKSYIDGQWVVVGGGGGTKKYSDLEEKPLINGVELDGNKTSSDLGVATSQQGAKADTAYQKPLSGIPESDLSSDVKQALQKHFKGWLTSTSQLPSNPVVGDYAYVEENGTTYIYRCSTNGEWPSTSTEEKEPADITFADGEEVNETHIDDTHLVNPKSGALPTAYDALQLKAKLEGVTATEIKATWEEYKVNNVGGFYKEESGTISWANSSNGNYKSCVVDIDGYNSVRFLGIVKTTDATTPVFIFVQMDANNNMIYYEHYRADTSSSVPLGEYETKVVRGAKKLICLIKGGATSQLQPEKYYCYLSKGTPATIKEVQRVAKKIDVSLYGISRAISSDNKTWGTTASTTKTIAIPVKGGDVVKLQIGRINAAVNASNKCFLLKDGFVDKDVDLAIVDGYLPISLSENSLNVIEIPNECTNIAMTTLFGNVVRIEILSVVVESVKEEQDEKSYISVEKIKEEVGYYRVNGTLNTDTSSKSAFFKIEEGKNYYINTRIGYLGTSDSLLNSAYVSYLADDMVTWLGYEEALVARGYVLFVHNYKLTLPEGTKYIMATIPSSSYEFGVFAGVENAVVDAINYVELDIEETIWGNIEGSEESVPTIRKSAWGFRLPSNYNEKATPTPIIAMLHGANGYVTPNVLGYGNNGGTATSADWKEWQDKYLNAGFAVFDINGYGIYSEDHDSAVHSGNPMAIETMKKAFEYLKKHYNVADRMFIHGTSMGGGLAQTYIRVYPEDVISVALFAPQCNAYSSTITQGVGVPDTLARNWGYADEDEMIADGYSHFYNFNPLFNCMKIKKEDGSVAINKVSIEMMQDFIKDTDGITGDAEYQYVEKTIIPIKLWIGSSDTTAPMSMERAVYNAYYNGGTTIKLRIVNGATHSFGAGGSHTFVADEAIRFFKESL